MSQMLQNKMKTKKNNRFYKSNLPVFYMHEDRIGSGECIRIIYIYIYIYIYENITIWWWNYLHK